MKYPYCRFPILVTCLSFSACNLYIEDSQTKPDGRRIDIDVDASAPSPDASTPRPDAATTTCQPNEVTSESPYRDYSVQTVEFVAQDCGTISQAFLRYELRRPGWQDLDLTFAFAFPVSWNEMGRVVMPGSFEVQARIYGGDDCQQFPEFTSLRVHVSSWQENQSGAHDLDIHLEFLDENANGFGLVDITAAGVFCEWANLLCSQEQLPEGRVEQELRRQALPHCI